MTQNWVQAIIGLWVLISPWLMGFSDVSLMKWSNVIMGTVLVLINVWVIFGEKKVVQ